MPWPRHLRKRQYWHRLRCVLVISQSPLATHVYTRLFCTVRLKKPLHLREGRFPFVKYSVNRWRWRSDQPQSRRLSFNATSADNTTDPSQVMIP